MEARTCLLVMVMITVVDTHDNVAHAALFTASSGHSTIADTQVPAAPGSIRVPAPELDPSSIGTISYPAREPGDSRMCGQRIDGVELSLERLVVEGGVDVGMARPAQQRKPMLDVAAIEVPLVPAVLVPRPGNQVVTGQLTNVPLAQFASPTSTHSASVVHAGDDHLRSADASSRSRGGGCSGGSA